MYTIRCEQFKLEREEQAPPERTVIYVLNFTPVPVAGPAGQGAVLQIGTMMVELVLDEAERERLHALTAPVDTAESLALLGEERPDGAALARCGRLQPHPSHIWLQPGGENGDDLERMQDLVWCDGQPAHAPFGEPTNDLPEPSVLVDGAVSDD